MKVQYQFQIVFIRLSLKKPLKRETNFQLALVDSPNSITISTSQLEASFQEIKIKRIQKIVDLQKLSSFKFRIEQDSKSVDRFALELRFEGNESEVELVALKSSQMIAQFEQSKKSIVELKHEWPLAQLEFKVYVSTRQVEALTLNVYDPALEKVSSLKSNNISRSKRPPELNISRKGALATSQARSIQVQQQQQLEKAKVEQQLFKRMESSPKDLPVSFANKTSPKYLEPQSPITSFPETFSALALFKKKHKVVEPQNQHVKQLIQSHHPHDETGGHTTTLSLKLKAVIALIVIGLLFLIVDTLTDRQLKKYFKGNKNPGKHDHHSENEKKHKGKKSKKQHKSHKKNSKH